MRQLALLVAPAHEPPCNPDPPPDGSPAPPEGVTTAREPAPREALGRVSPAPTRHEAGDDGHSLASPSTLRNKLMARRRRELLNRHGG